MTTFYTMLNNAMSSLVSPHQVGDGQLTVVDATVFGNPSPPAPIRVTCRRITDGAYVIFGCTNITGNVLSGLTVLEGTTDKTLWIGTSVAIEDTAGTFTDIYDAINDVGTGSQGPPGPQGPQGNASTVAGPQGSVGSTGSAGPQGTTGTTGSAGPQGTTGTTGSAGPQGTTGTTGSAGPQGTQGNQGSTGSQGIGFQGAAGSPGAQGPQGYQGGAGGGGTPGGSSTQIQYNSSGSFAGATALTTASGSPLTITSQAVGDIPLTIQATASPTGRLLKITDSTPTEQFAIGADFNVYKGGNLFLHNTGTNSVFVGVNSGNATQTAFYNTGVGVNSLHAVTGNSNTAIGYNAAAATSSGTQNTAIGYFSLNANTTGSFNTSVGAGNLSAMTGGNNVTAVGCSVFSTLTTGTAVTGIGCNVFNANNGAYNIGVGNQVFVKDAGSILVGVGNFLGQSSGTPSNSYAVAIGYGNWNGIGTAAFNYSVSIGYEANRYRGGQSCVSIGYHSGYNDGATAITGDNCTMVGALTNVGNGFTYATAIGAGALASQSNSCVLGGTTGTNFVDLGIGTATPGAKVHAVADSASKIGLIVQQAASSTVDQVQHRNSSGSPISGVNKTGDYYLSTTSGAPSDTPTTNSLRFDPTNKFLYAYTGTAWVKVALA